MDSNSQSLRIGVLALQGAFREHFSLLKAIPCVAPVEVRTTAELFSVNGLIIPGGESTTMALIAQKRGLLDSLVQFMKEGRPIWGTCAGLILLAERLEGTKQGGQSLIGGLDILVARNFFGAQVDSFEIELPSPPCLTEFGSAPFRGVFIRAPAILEIGETVDALCELELDVHQRKIANRNSVVVAVKSRNILATAFHPELTGDTRWHQLFASIVQEYQGTAEGGVVSVIPLAGKPKHSIPSELPVYGKTHVSRMSEL